MVCCFGAQFFAILLSGNTEDMRGGLGAGTLAVEEIEEYSEEEETEEAEDLIDVDVGTVGGTTDRGKFGCEDLCFI